MTLANPTQGLSMYDLYPDSIDDDQATDTPLARFAKDALWEWVENIPSAGRASRTERRVLMGLLARQFGIDPLHMVATVLLQRRAQRLAAYDVRFLFQKISA